MRYSAVMIIAACAALVAGVASAAPKNPDSSGGGGAYHFVGFSTSAGTGDIKVTGGVGIPGLNEACQLVFGDLARMATSAEYLDSPDAYAPSPETAWIRAGNVSAYGTNFVLDPASAQIATGPDMTCDSWKKNAGTNTGLLVTEVGGFVIGFCDASRMVACSAP